MKVVEVNASCGVGVGGDGDHTGLGTPLEPVQKEVGQQERRQMVDRKGAFQSVDGDVAGVPVATDVVDQHVDPRQNRKHLAGQPPHLRLRGQVRDEHLDLDPSRCADLAGRILGAKAVPAGYGDVSAHRGQS